MHDQMRISNGSITWYIVVLLEWFRNTKKNVTQASLVLPYLSVPVYKSFTATLTCVIGSGKILAVHMRHAKPKVISRTSLKIRVFWDVTLCNGQNGCVQLNAELADSPTGRSQQCSAELHVQKLCNRQCSAELHVQKLCSGRLFEVKW
jgi:hypothetical protein